jgi:hypothetical protein
VRAAPRGARRYAGGIAAPLHIVRKPLVNTAAIRADWVHDAGLSCDAGDDAAISPSAATFRRAEGVPWAL